MYIGGVLVVLVLVIVIAVSCSSGEKNEEQTTTSPEVTDIAIPEETTVEETTASLMYTTDVLNLRKKPNTNAEIITQIGAGKRVDVLGEEGKWCKVQRGTEVGYVMKKYLSYEKAVD